MAKTLAQWRKALYGVNIEPAKKHKYAYPALYFLSLSCCRLRLISSPLISLVEQAEVDAQPPQATDTTRCQIDAEAIKKPDELSQCPPGAGPDGDPKPRVVQVTLRGRHLFLLPKSTTDPDSLVKEAAHFDRAITS